MLNRDTQPLPLFNEAIQKRIGIIGATAKAGATFICNLLERERYCRLGEKIENNLLSNFEIIDLGETDFKGDTDCVMIVVDCRKEFSNKVTFAAKALEERKIPYGLVFNFWDEEYKIPEIILENENLIYFRIPEIKFTYYTDLYNFVFYS